MSEQSDPMRTALYELHREAGAKLIEFGGWMMPVQYSGIIAEHRKVREAAGAFDLSHMGRLYISGHDALAFLQLLVTNDVSKLAPMQVQYSPVCNRSGGVRDDILISRLGENEYLLVVNASNREKILGWIDEVAKGVGGGSMGFSLEDRTLDTVMIGVQGPLSERFLQPLTEVSLSDLRYYYLSAGPVLGVQGLVSRTGYTGEDGFEVILPAESGVRLWRELAQVASTGSMVLAGLGARGYPPAGGGDAPLRSRAGRDYQPTRGSGWGGSSGWRRASSWGGRRCSRSLRRAHEGDWWAWRSRTGLSAGRGPRF